MENRNNQNEREQNQQNNQKEQRQNQKENRKYAPLVPKQAAGQRPAACFHAFSSRSGGRPTSGINSRSTIRSISSSFPHSSEVNRAATRSITISI